MFDNGVILALADLDLDLVFQCRKVLNNSESTLSLHRFYVKHLLIVMTVLYSYVVVSALGVY